MKKVLITGATGFAGSFLSEHLADNHELELFGTCLTTPSDLASFSHIKLETLDLLNKDAIFAYIADIKPDQVYHLAALSSPGDSFRNPAETITQNVTIQVNLLEGLRNANLGQTRILITSSADVYGKVAPIDLPIDEDTSFHPTNPYSVSKLAQDYLGLQYFLSYQMQIIRVRAFNHIGPRQSPHFVVASFARKIAEIEKGTDTVMKVGNLESKRDFTDVRDMMKAYNLVMEKGTAGDVYNAGSGKSYKIEEILKMLLSFATKEIHIEIDPTLFRPIDTPELICDSSKLKCLGEWKITIPIEQTLKETLEYWRQNV